MKESKRPSHQLYCAGSPRLWGRAIQAQPFAVALTSTSDCLPGQLIDVAGIGEVLRLQCGMGSESQSLYLHPRLLSASSVAARAAEAHMQLMTALMVADCERIYSGEASALEKQLDSADDVTTPLALRFLVGCIFRPDGSPPGLLPTQRQWDECNARHSAEQEIIDQLGSVTDSLVSRFHRIQVQAPASVPDALAAGILALVEQNIAASNCDHAASISRSRDGEFELTLSSQTKGLRLRLPVAALGRQRVDFILASTHAMLACREEATWCSASLMH